MPRPLNFITVGATCIVAAAAYYFLSKEVETKVQSQKNNRKRKKTLTSLSKRVDDIINSTPDARLAIVLLENIQLEVDGISVNSEKKRSKRKKLNMRINESIAQLEKEAESQPENNMKGYRIRKDGTKTTFFHRDLDEKAKALIGDTAPKRIKVDSTSNLKDENVKKSGSEWNGSGNTWESKTVTKKAKVILREMLKCNSIVCHKITGDVTLVIKKNTSLIYDLEIMLTAENQRGTAYLLSGDDPTAEGIKGGALKNIINVLSNFETEFFAK